MPIPATITLSQPADDSLALPPRSDNTAIQTAINALIGWATTAGIAAFGKANGVYDLNTSTTESSLVSGATASGTTGWLIPGNTLGANGIVRVQIVGDYLNNSGGNVNETYKVKFGGTTFFGHLQAVSASATRHPLYFDFLLGNEGVTNSNYASGIYTPGNINGPTAGTVAGIVGGGSDGQSFSSAVQTIDTTADCYLDVTVQHGTSSGAVSARRLLALAEIL